MKVATKLESRDASTTVQPKEGARLLRDGLKPQALHNRETRPNIWTRVDQRECVCQMSKEDWRKGLPLAVGIGVHLKNKKPSQEKQMK